MTVETIQPALAERITLDPALKLLGTPIQVDPLADPDTAKSAISAQLSATGVCIEIDFPAITSPETSLGGSTSIDAVCEVFVAENIQKSHTPNRAALLAQVIRAVTKRYGAQNPPRLRTSESVKTEHGYVLHMLSFFVPLNIKQ